MPIRTLAMLCCIMFCCHSWASSFDFRLILIVASKTYADAPENVDVGKVVNSVTTYVVLFSFGKRACNAGLRVSQQCIVGSLLALSVEVNWSMLFSLSEKLSISDCPALWYELRVLELHDNVGTVGVSVFTMMILISPAVADRKHHKYNPIPQHWWWLMHYYYQSWSLIVTWIMWIH